MLFLDIDLFSPCFDMEPPTCHMSKKKLNYKKNDKMIELVNGGYVFNRAYPV